MHNLLISHRCAPSSRGWIHKEDFPVRSKELPTGVYVLSHERVPAKGQCHPPHSHGGTPLLGPAGSSPTRHTHTQRRNQTPCESSTKPTLRDVWKNVIRHLSTHDCHHTQTQSQNVTGRIHTHTHTHTPITSRDPHQLSFLSPPLNGQEESNPCSPSLSPFFPPSLPLPFLPCVVFFEERVLFQKL